MIDQTSELMHQNPSGSEIRWSLLYDFERNLDPLNPQANRIPCHVLGYGEISTAFEIQVGEMSGFAFKRLSCFERPEELRPYVDAYLTYNHLLEQHVGLHLPNYGYAAFTNEHDRPVVYLIQQRLNPDSIGNCAIHYLATPQIIDLFWQVIWELHKVWTFNNRGGEYRVCIDGQISNWAIEGFDAHRPELIPGSHLLYLDTSTPMFLRNGKEQLDIQIFLRSAPPYLVWILRLLFLQDIRTRYFDPRKVIIDLIANFYKEQRAELIPNLIAAANQYIHAEAASLGLAEISQKEVQDYYREDAIIWRLYLGMRRFDRFIRRKMLHRDYPYILPGSIQR